MIPDATRTNDGQWHADTKAGHSMVKRNALKKTGLVEWRQRAYTGHVFRCIDGKWENETCPHWHTKRGAAIRCAEQAARRWNRQEKAAAKWS